MKSGPRPNMLILSFYLPLTKSGWLIIRLSLTHNIAIWGGDKATQSPTLAFYRVHHHQIHTLKQMAAIMPLQHATRSMIYDQLDPSLPPDPIAPARQRSSPTRISKPSGEARKRPNHPPWPSAGEVRMRPNPRTRDTPEFTACGVATSTSYNRLCEYDPVLSSRELATKHSNTIPRSIKP